MFRWLLLLIITVPAAEIGVLVWAGGIIGPWWVVLLIIVTGIIGAALAKHQGLETIYRAQRSISSGVAPKQEIYDGICILIGAVMLLSPGFITDIVGFLLLIPLTRKPINSTIQKAFHKMIESGRITTFRR